MGEPPDRHLVSKTEQKWVRLLPPMPCHAPLAQLAEASDSSPEGSRFESGVGYVKRLRIDAVSWSTVLAVVGLLGAVFLVVVGLVGGDRSILDSAVPVALVGIGWAIVSYRDRA